jgi:hypothetical protein
MSLQSLTSMIGSSFTVARRDQQPAHVKMTELLEKTGKMQNGDQLPYCLLTDGEDKWEMHPRVMLSVLKNGNNSGVTMIKQEEQAAPVEVVSEAAPVEVVSEETVEVSSALVVVSEVIEIADEVVGDVVTSTKDNGDVVDIVGKEVTEETSEAAPEAVVMTGWAASLNQMTSAPSNPVVAEKPKNEKPASKKAIAGRVYLAGVAAGHKRKVIIADMMAAAGLSDNGAGTYYQNFKSGQWTAA